LTLAKDVAAFCKRLGLEFNNPNILIEALTHSSLSSPTRTDNQRLEFLGDRVLGLTIAQALFQEDAKADEGELAPRFNALVRKETCAEIADGIGLGEIIKIGRSEMLSGGRRKQTILGDGIEALIAAIYLDQGFEVAQAFILKEWAAKIAAAPDDARDAKTALQEWAQARKMPPPSYVETARSGPDHAPIFEIEVRLQSGQVASAKAASKRGAQQLAAAALLTELEQTT